MNHYRSLDRSSRPRPAGTVPLTALDPFENVSIIIQIRRRLGAPAVPTLQHWANIPFPKRRFLTPAEFAAKHGAAQSDINAVSDYVASHGMKVLDVNTGSRMLRISASASQLATAFRVQLTYYELDGEKFRGFDGSVYLPEELLPIVEAILGLDNRERFKPRGVPGAPFLNPSEVANLYEFPSGPAVAAGQTIAIISLSNAYLPSDINGFYGPQGPGAGLQAPNIVFPDPLAPPNYSITGANGRQL